MHEVAIWLRITNFEFMNVLFIGKNNYKAWKDYKKAIKKHLESVNPDPRLKEAREKIAKKIESEHFKRFPKWPTKDQMKQESIVDVGCSGGYRYFSSNTDDFNCSESQDETEGRGTFIVYCQ